MSLTYLQDRQTDLRTLLYGLPSNPLLKDFVPMARLMVGLTQHKDSGARLMVFEAQTLDAFMVAEIALMLSGHTGILSCEQCGKLILIKAGRAKGGHRADARYCSEKCRNAAYYKRKSKTG